MNDVRARAADRMVEEMLGYVLEKILPGANLRDPEWEAMSEPDRKMMEAIGAYERGEISFDELEAAGVEYVEAFQRVAASAATV